MPLEQVQPDAVLPIAERRLAGQALRKIVPRSLHARWKPPPNRHDPLQTLVETSRHRIARLLPIRYARMRASPFAFMRGAAAIMAADLAETPASGLWVQACGDCHLANFGTFAAPDGSPVFDINDFDETLPAPFEWDVKRLATSFALDAQARSLGDKAARQLARTVTLAYRMHLTSLARLAPLDAWRSHADVAGFVDAFEEPRLRDREFQRIQAATEASHKGYPKLLEKRRGTWRIRDKLPLIMPITDQYDDTHEIVARTAFSSYQLSLPEERRILVDRYRLVDVAFKVVGIGSVGTFCAIGLFVTPEDGVLLLQLKEAQSSVLAPFAGPSVYANQGQRVVIGQRIIQGQSDIFLGWTQEPRNDQHCYVRQLKDSRVAMIAETMADGALPHYATLCGATLARAHARSGDAARIAGYMGSGGVFDAAIADFAMAYATQTERDWRLFVEAIKAGLIDARES
ncbi:MAG: DUF2252 domain-containing protein [Acetobacteraceae bacterium]|nr:DUF2252 domain-containing protein [Acetobacteraceae bacterium]